MQEMPQLPQHTGLLGQLFEWSVLFLVALSPWLLGASEPVFEFCLYVGLTVLMILWGLRIILQRTATPSLNLIAFGLGLLVVVSLLQVVPLPVSLLEFLSPATAETYARLLSAEPEQLPRAVFPDQTLSSEFALSVYPAVTYLQARRLLAAFLFFLVIYNNVSSPSLLKRLGWVALINGAALALFGIIQYSSSGYRLLFWSIPHRGYGFGPFIYRNHFSCYMNLCLGVGVGLLLSRLRSRKNQDQPVIRSEHFVFRLFGYDITVVQLWISLALVLMVFSLVICQSRAGVIVPAAVGFFFLLALWRKIRVAHTLLIAAVILAALGLLSTHGFGWTESRFHSIWSGEIWQGYRWDKWGSVFPLLQEYSLWGTGLGTFPYVERPCQTPGYWHNEVTDDLLNEYLQTWIEGGLVMLVVAVGTVVLIFRRGIQALGLQMRSSVTVLTCGALFALATVTLHSSAENVMRSPAIVLFTIVLAVVLCQLGEAARKAAGLSQQTDATPADSALPFRKSQIASILAWLFLFLLSLVVCWEGWKSYRSHKLLLASVVVEQQSETASLQKKIALLEGAIAYTPDSARLHVLLGDAYLDLYERQADEKDAPTEKRRPKERSEKLLHSGLGHHLKARHLCPLLPRPHVRLAAYQPRLLKGDSRMAYLERALSLAPWDAELWYACGLQRLLDGQPQQAWPYWRKSLQLSDRHLRSIVRYSLQFLEPSELPGTVFAEDPEMLYRAAWRLFPVDEAKTERRPFLRKALQMLLEAPDQLDAAEWRLKARIHAEFDQSEDAFSSYQKALLGETNNISWRLEYVRLLRQHGRKSAARPAAHSASAWP